MVRGCSYVTLSKTHYVQRKTPTLLLFCGLVISLCSKRYILPYPSNESVIYEQPLNCYDRDKFSKTFTNPLLTVLVFSHSGSDKQNVRGRSKRTSSFEGVGGVEGVGQKMRSLHTTYSDDYIPKGNGSGLFVRKIWRHLWTATYTHASEPKKDDVIYEQPRASRLACLAASRLAKREIGRYKWIAEAENNPSAILTVYEIWRGGRLAASRLPPRASPPRRLACLAIS